MNELRGFREALDVRQAAVAKKLGVSRQAVHELETRPIETISPATVLRYKAAARSLVADSVTSEESARFAAAALKAAGQSLLDAARSLVGAGTTGD